MSPARSFAVAVALLAGACGFTADVIAPCVDADGDGYPSSACGGTDCVDSNPRIHPGAVEACNVVDDDCDEQIDEWTMATVAGQTTGGYRDGSRAQAQFNKPVGLALSGTGVLYVAESVSPTVRAVDLRLDPGDSRYVTTVAGLPGASGPLRDGNRLTATFGSARALAWAPGGAQGVLYVTDVVHHALRRVNLSSGSPDTDAAYVTTVAGDGTAGTQDGAGASARFDRPAGLAVNAAGEVFVADSGNSCIRKVDAQGNVSTFAGRCGTAGFADGPHDVARFSGPTGLAVDAQGALLVADWSNNRIREVSPQGVVSTLAGDGTGDFADGLAQGVAKLRSPTDVAADPASGNIYICDLENQRIRVLDPSGYVLSIIGTGSQGDSGDGPACGRKVADPFAVKVAPDGSFYIADANNYRIRRVTP